MEITIKTERKGHALLDDLLGILPEQTAKELLQAAYCKQEALYTKDEILDEIDILYGVEKCDAAEADAEGLDELVRNYLNERSEYDRIMDLEYQLMDMCINDYVRKSL